jgi:GNAT superfamily N-acetyltransferase
MTIPYFVDAHAPQWVAHAKSLTMDYFRWMNQEIIKACQFSISDIVGMPLDDYVISAADTICPNNTSESAFYLLTVSDVPVGMGGLRKLPDGNGEIVRIYVDPACRGKGYGTLIMRHLISEARRLEYQQLYLDTGDFMKSAHRLYESLGFVDCDAYAGAEPPVELHPYWRFMSLDLSQ